jgi:uncharacterized membrane protein
VQKGEDPRKTDSDILKRGAIIAILDPTLISLTSGRWTLQVLFAIGASMMLMVPLRRLPQRWLIAAGLSWAVLGEAITDPFWDQGVSWPHPVVATLAAALVAPTLKIVYPVLPWLSMMVLGWAFGRYLVGRLAANDTRGPQLMLWGWGLFALTVFAVVRGFNDYGNMFLLRADGTWEQWLHVSKYPPSLSFTALELGLLCVCLAGMISLERRIGVRRNGPLLVFGQTAMFFYLVHRVVYETAATWLDLRGDWGSRRHTSSPPYRSSFCTPLVAGIARSSGVTRRASSATSDALSAAGRAGCAPEGNSPRV